MDDGRYERSGCDIERKGVWKRREWNIRRNGSSVGGRWEKGDWNNACAILLT